MSDLMQALSRYIGMQGDIAFACDRVEAGAVRRHAQAIMDESACYAADSADQGYGGPIAPPMFPAFMFRRALGTPDVVQQRADDPDYDGSGTAGLNGLPELEPLRGYGVLNGGSDLEFYRYVRHGERVYTRSRYGDISERQARKGPLIIVKVENDYRTDTDELLMRITRTYLWSRA